jgi:SAM-dependent methyltransferase
MIIKTCEVCDNQKLFSVLNLGTHPLCDDLKKIGSNQVNKKYKIEILYCKNCFTAHQKYQVNKKILFNKDYHYRARFTNDVLNGMQNLVQESLKLFKDDKKKTVLDVGCNDGSLLNFFYKKGLKTIGVEPTNAFKDASNKHKIYNNFFDNSLVKKIKSEKTKIDLISFTNVFAHIENLNELLNNLKLLIEKDTILVIENHYLGSIIEKNQFDTFYHEHPRTYSLKSFIYIGKKLGLNILKVQFPKRYGGNIRVFFTKSKIKSNTDQMKKVLLKEKKFFKKFELIKKKIEVWKIKKYNQIKKIYLIHGKVAAKAFPGRAAILIRLLNINEKFISKVYEKPNSKKIGYCVPGTNIPIISDKQLFKDIKEKKVNIIINLAWHLSKEIKTYLIKKKYKGNIIDIL